VFEGAVKVFFFPDEASARTAKGVGRAYDEGKADFLSRFFAFEEGIGDVRRGYFHAQLLDVGFEGLAVFGQLDGLQVYAYEFDSVLFPQS